VLCDFVIDPVSPILSLVLLLILSPLKLTLVRILVCCCASRKCSVSVATHYWTFIVLTFCLLFLSDECYVFDHQASAGNQWTALPNLPNGGRGGGGLVYIHEANSLVYAGGATRSGWVFSDKTEAWILDLGNLNAGWSATTNIPFAANHLSAVTAKDGSGAWRTYFMGGQVEEKEGSSENKDLYEFVYNPNGADQWVKRADMPVTQDHASSSTKAYGCGFIIAGGTQNGGGKVRYYAVLHTNTVDEFLILHQSFFKQTKDISYYDPLDGPNGKWTKIGDLPSAINTPVCDFSLDINGEDWMYCETGNPYVGFSKRRKISVA